MDSKEAAGSEEPVAAAPSSPRATAPDAVAGVQPAPSPGDAASATAAPTRAVESGDEDEQVERFYALLANVRAMRGMYRSGGEASERAKKRARGAEPAWRPAFRMEDFEEESAASSANKKAARRPGKETADEHGGDVERKGRGVVASPSSPSPSPPRARAGYGSRNV